MRHESSFLGLADGSFEYRKLFEENGFQTRTYSFYNTFPFSKLIIAVRTPVGTGRSIC